MDIQDLVIKRIVPHPAGAELFLAFWCDEPAPNHFVIGHCFVLMVAPKWSTCYHKVTLFTIGTNMINISQIMNLDTIVTLKSLMNQPDWSEMVFLIEDSSSHQSALGVLDDYCIEYGLYETH